MKYQNAKYTNALNTNISVFVGGSEWFVPCVGGNSMFREIMEAIDRGELTIAPYTPPPQPKVRSITMRQCRLQLLAAGFLDDAESMVAQAEKSVQIEWEFSTVVERSSTLVSYWLCHRSV